MRDCLYDGGGRGIRTPARFNPPVGFQDRSLQPDLGIPPYQQKIIYHTSNMNVNKETKKFRMNKTSGIFRNYIGLITSRLPIYGRKTVGMMTLPSAC
jgi:hypothetical protein